MFGRPDNIAFRPRSAGDGGSSPGASPARIGPAGAGCPAAPRALAGRAALAIVLLAPPAFLACSAAPVRMECRELQMRIDYGDLTADQMRFAMEELADCQGRAREAEKKDSALIEGAERRFTPAEE